MNIFISGKPGCGKSTLVQALIDDLHGNVIAGIVTPEIRDNGRIGFRIIDLASGKKEILASVKIKKGPRVGRYGIDIRAVDRIVDCFFESFEKAEIIFLDEIGTMELFSRKFKEMCKRVLNSEKIVVAVIHRNLVKDYQDKGLLYWLEKDKFNEIKAEIIRKIG